MLFKQSIKIDNWKKDVRLVRSYHVIIAISSIYFYFISINELRNSKRHYRNIKVKFPLIGRFENDFPRQNFLFSINLDVSYSRKTYNRINRIHKRALRLIYEDNLST